MNQKLLRLNSEDGIELVGLLSTPNIETNNLVIHIHGLGGNFYENRFLDVLAQSYVDKQHAFLSVNTRGSGFISEFFKTDGEIATIGATYEQFEDCVLDIEGIVKWSLKNNYTNIILQGHSYGCNKILYYYKHNPINEIKKLVLLAPCDIPAETVKFISAEEYTKLKDDSTNLVLNNPTELIDFSIMGNGKIAAKTFYDSFLPGGANDFIKYSEVGVNNEILNNINIPVLCIFGDEDVCVLTEKIDIVNKYLKDNINNITIEIIAGANHSYMNKYGDLDKAIKDNF